MTKQRVLVTGGSGFIAGHCILRLLDQGYLVRTTVRSPAKESAVRTVLTDSDDLSFAEADLMSDEGWAEAVSGCDFVLHVASPVRPGAVTDENDLIVPAREGTLRVLRAARDAGVRRVVLTSAFHAVGWGHPPTGHVFTEDDWSVLDGPGIDAYGKSKTLAERAAWDFIGAEGGSTELVTVLPVAVMGPRLGAEVSGANHIVQLILDRKTAGLPDLWIPIVDVRDVAEAHVMAMTTPEAAGQRFLLSGGPALRVSEIAALLEVPFEDAGAAADHERKVSGEKARRVLGWRPREPRDAVLAAADSLVRR
ncbi:SDR family oxidoreductase [Herbidospora cretacea]|uniref:SDR family oxidoreductase n=1 Tax=Herbidospora cretacea TaxID=28444 RepID=UPI000774BE88|nr:aldehyde reductase [Herbidospora cretacea]